MRVRDTMTRNVMFLSPDDTLDEAYDLMLTQEIRHLPVVEGTNLVGILSDRDVLLRAELGDEAINVPQIPVRDAMTKGPITCDTRTTVSEAATMLIENHISCLPVTSLGELVGMITTTDMLDLLCRSRDDSGHQYLPFKFQVTKYSGKTAATGASSIQ